MRDPAAHPPLSVEEYLRLEEASAVRHEFVAAEVYATTGGTLRHNQIASDILTRLMAMARGGPCHVYINDVKLRIGDDFYYPDVLVDCEPHEDDEVYVRHPCLVVEVLSESTRRTDRREKLEACTRVPALRAYLLVEQGLQRVERHWRDERGAWRHEEVSATSGASVVPVPCLATMLTLAEIYDGVDVPAAPTRPRRVREG
ncbi:MAG TPA: Uma2 family endonuclease [Gemmatimonadaceae bacterium]|nr:Uma2 family endonuclease [Gemmatimonadaceae bacterium]